ncbi:hypothetical protein GCM10009617_01270 [Leifsonia poae]|uniref:Uncharacterized protein n=1 Tax=Leifsonia poae TaxID=110933 RepID=A0A9W6H5Z0_9MICO|nr:hypothetical protein GCM10017584_01280 [Leifsonia poae]
MSSPIITSEKPEKWMPRSHLPVSVVLSIFTGTRRERGVATEPPGCVADGSGAAGWRPRFMLRHAPGNLRDAPRPRTRTLSVPVLDRPPSFATCGGQHARMTTTSGK